MTRPLLILLMLLASAQASQAQSNPADESTAPARTYHLLREDDDWSFLADPAASLLAFMAGALCGGLINVRHSGRMQARLLKQAIAVLPAL
jgi:hypothetical protein